MDDSERTRLDALLNLLADEVAKRLGERSASRPMEPERPPAVTPVPVSWSAPETIAAPASEVAPEPELEEAPEEGHPEPDPDLPPEIAPHPGVSIPSHTASLMARLALGVLLIVVLINIPLNTQGLALARSIPNSTSLVITDGLVVKEATSPEIWVYRDGTFHWIASLDAFQHFGYRWQDVHIVEPGFLNRFAKGSPLYVLAKCDSSPHIYRIEAGLKRWIVDIPTLRSEGHVWQDVKAVSCSYLRSLPDGESVPPGRGSPPSPLP